jgi:hypothetical protein
LLQAAEGYHHIDAGSAGLGERGPGLAGAVAQPEDLYCDLGRAGVGGPHEVGGGGQGMGVVGTVGDHLVGGSAG